MGRQQKGVLMAAQYETITLGVNDLDRIKLPKFQRGFVWNKTKKIEFVQTLANGYPFGALLVYPESQEADSKLLLLDGQQRLSTIQQYKNDPLSFWKPNNFDEYRESLSFINGFLSEDHQLNEKDFDALVNEKTDLADWVDEVLEDADKEVRKVVRDKVKEIRGHIADYVDLDSLGILAIKFIGSKECIADVFANLNKGGMPLSKYEIFGAAWVNTEITLDSAGVDENQDEILNLVKEYYQRMETNAEFELNNFSEDELSRERVVTLSEFGTAYGAFIQRHLPALIPDNSSAQNEIGFGVLGVSTGIDNRHLEKLVTKVGEIDKDMHLRLEKTKTICNDLQSAFSKLVKRIMAGKSEEYLLGLSASFKTLSYFAALWDLDPSSAEYKETLKNIPAYYVFDFWSKVWTSHGDQRLMDYYPKLGKRDYRKRLTSEQMMDAYRQWAADTTPGINFAKEVKALATIHANLSYLSATVSHGETFELEHIIAKKLIKEADGSSVKRLFGGALGNCMYLPRQDNNKKKEKNLYEVNSEGKYDELMSGSLYFSEFEFGEIGKALDERDFESLNRYIEARGERVAQVIINKLLGA